MRSYGYWILATVLLAGCVHRGGESRSWRTYHGRSTGIPVADTDFDGSSGCSVLELRHLHDLPKPLKIGFNSARPKWGIPFAFSAKEYKWTPSPRLADARSINMYTTIAVSELPVESDPCFTLKIPTEICSYLKEPERKLLTELFVPNEVIFLNSTSESQLHKRLNSDKAREVQIDACIVGKSRMVQIRKIGD